MQNIFLVGPMGSGKSTIGRQLATRLGKEFYDSDREIEARTGVDIALIFEIEGEQGFRKRETAMLEELAGLHDVIIATGGGVVLSADNRNLLNRSGTVVYLKSSPERLFERTARDKKRPLLNTEDRKLTIQKLLDDRNPLYEEVADIVISTDDEPIKLIVSNINQELEKK